MAYQYVKVVDDETQRVLLVGRFQNGLPEIFKDGEWKPEGYMYSWQRDGLLDNVTEAEAMKLIKGRNSDLSPA